MATDQIHLSMDLTSAWRVVRSAERCKSHPFKIPERPVALSGRGKTDLIAVYAVQDTQDSDWKTWRATERLKLAEPFVVKSCVECGALSIRTKSSGL